MIVKVSLFPRLTRDRMRTGHMNIESIRPVLCVPASGAGTRAFIYLEYNKVLTISIIKKHTMNTEKKVKEAFDLAAERFAAVNVDVNSALEKLRKSVFHSIAGRQMT